MTSRDAAGRNRVTRMTSDGSMKNVWAETPRAEGGDLALVEDNRFHPATGDDVSQLFHGSKVAAIELHLRGLQARPGLSNSGMLGEGITDAVFLTPDFDEALAYGDTVVKVDARGLDLIVVDGPDGYHYATTEPINPSRLSTPAAVGFENVLDPTLRSECVAYSRRYAPGPKNPARYEPDWSRSHTKPTYELEPGDRLASGGVVTGTEELTETTILVRVDGEAQASESFDYDAATTIHNDSVDLSDPDWFEAEAQRVTKKRIAQARSKGLTVNRKQARDTENEVRAALTRVHQHGRAVIAVDEHPDACHGRANVGQVVSFEQPGSAKRTYKVIGKIGIDAPQQTSSTFTRTDSGGVEYVVEDTRSGNQSRVDMRYVGWRHES